jgi:rubrerythrin
METQKITDDELYILSYYRACELSGAILFGRLALHTKFDEIRSKLTEHTLEEAKHAWLWNKTIEDLGRVPVKVTNHYQTEYGKEYGMPTDVVEILCLTQVFEKRTLEHFEKHLHKKDLHPLIHKTLADMIEDEAGHISWVRDYLDKYEKENGPERVESLLARMQEVDDKIYTKLEATEPFKSYFAYEYGK